MQPKTSTHVIKNKRMTTRATLLIPQELWQILDRHLKRNQLSLGQYFKTIAERAHAMEDRWPQATERFTTRYQEENQDLQRRHLRANPWDWHLMKRLAAKNGISICFAFVAMLIIDLLGEADEQAQVEHLNPSQVVLRFAEFLSGQTCIRFISLE